MFSKPIKVKGKLRPKDDYLKFKQSGNKTWWTIEKCQKNEKNSNHFILFKFWTWV